jgi:hypothetical protein
MAVGSNGSTAQRYVVVVPRDAPDTLDYLTESFKDVPDVEVVLDRRQRAAAASAPQPVERRDDHAAAVEAFGCTLVRVSRRGNGRRQG